MPKPSKNHPKTDAEKTLKNERPDQSTLGHPGIEPDPKLSVDRKLRIGNWLVAWIGNWNGWIGNWLWPDRKLERLDRRLALAGSETGKAGSETWGWSSRKLGFVQLGALLHPHS